MDPKLILTIPPPLHPDWLAHEKDFNLLVPKPIITDPYLSQKRYSDTCKAANAELLAGRDKHLRDIVFHDTDIAAHPGSAGTHYVRTRCYHPLNFPVGPSYVSTNSRELRPIVIYFHGGGLYNGDLDSEDLTCRRICKALECKVYSCTYRKMPQDTADDALFDAFRAFEEITTKMKASKLILMESSSGGLLAGQISQRYRIVKRGLIDGVLLRGPVTCNATEGGKYLPGRFKDVHTSMSQAFHTSLLSSAAVNNENRTTTALPLEAEDLRGMPKHWIQVSTNDVYYSDGACYAEALREAGVEVRLDVVEGWPHTFWLKAPYLERAVKAENDMIEVLRWLLEDEVREEKKV
jgi:acetyl esterase/lipase